MMKPLNHSYATLCTTASLQPIWCRLLLKAYSTSKGKDRLLHCKCTGFFCAGGPVGMEPLTFAVLGLCSARWAWQGLDQQPWWRQSQSYPASYIEAQMGKEKYKWAFAWQPGVNKYHPIEMSTKPFTAVSRQLIDSGLLMVQLSKCRDSSRLPVSQLKTHILAENPHFPGVKNGVKINNMRTKYKPNWNMLSSPNLLVEEFAYKSIHGTFRGILLDGFKCVATALSHVILSWLYISQQSRNATKRGNNYI